jgi:hypothetical protein
VGDAEDIVSTHLVVLPHNSPYRPFHPAKDCTQPILRFGGIHNAYIVQ